MDSAGVGVGVLSNVVTFIDSNGNSTSTIPNNLTVDFPDSSSVWGYYNPLTNITTVGLDLDILGLIDVSLGPLCTQKDFVQPLFEKIANRHNAAGQVLCQTVLRDLLANPDIKLETNTGKRIRAIKVQDGHYTFMLPANVQSVQIVSRTSRPCDVEGPFVDDRRKLGVAVGQITLRDARNVLEVSTHLENEELPGWYALEQNGTARWTNGNAKLDLNVRPASGIRMLSVQVLAAGPYLVSDATATQLAKRA
ncbi:hypothetical protein [Acetobacter ascendens]|uniref:hypothetical protein n=1 Tax=Acetobacter ascendens TaxID=481146 RepID=UPI000A8F792E|nr:hypothetical protein [Acetobacter ascendens]